MNQETKQAIEAIHNHQAKTVFVTAGAGTHALSDLLGVVGASRTLLEAIVPYGEGSFIDFLGARPRQFVHANTAKLMAGRAFTRAKWLANLGDEVIGLSCTATIATDRPKRGQHRAHIATWQREQSQHIYVKLKKGLRNRQEEETAVSQLILQALLNAYHLEYQLPQSLTDSDILEEKTTSYIKIAQALRKNKVPFFGVQEHGKLILNRAPSQLLLSGSFNPLHDGHLALAKTAASLKKMPIAFEISAFNVDKPPLDPQIMLNRLAQFAGRWPVYMTNARTFLEKARLFPNCIFVVGFDTAVRIISPRYYNNSQPEMYAALTEIRDQGCHFLVAGRVDRDGQFSQMSDLDIPADFQSLFSGIPSNLFRNDISSSLLRAKNQKGSR